MPGYGSAFSRGLILGAGVALLYAAARETIAPARSRQRDSVADGKRQSQPEAERTRLIDWNLARSGNGRFDVAFWLPSLRLEGGPEPWEVLPQAGALAAAVAGFFASRAGLAPPPGAPTVREFQRAQAEVALRWTVRELGLPSPSRHPN